MKTPSVSYGSFLRTIGWIGSVVVFFIILGASISETKLRDCGNLSIKIDHDKGLFFIDEGDVAKFIAGYCDTDALMRASMDFTEIEEKLEMNPFIQKAEIFSSTKGVIHADVRQREPLVRIVNNSGVSYYLDVNGTKIPTSSKFTARVVVATGHVENLSDSSVSAQLLGLCRFISQDDFWKAQFEQINVTREGEFELVPKIANHVIRLGKANDLDGKFHKLMIFYKEVLKNFDADNYRIVNLKFKGQIVCTKNTL